MAHIAEWDRVLATIDKLEVIEDQINYFKKECENVAINKTRLISQQKSHGQ